MSPSESVVDPAPFLNGKGCTFFHLPTRSLECQKSNPRPLCSLAGGQQSADDAAGLVGSHDLAHDGDPGGAGVNARPEEIGCHAAECDDGNPEVRCAPDRRNAQRWAVAGLAGGEENRAQGDVIGACGGRGGHIVEAMRGYSDKRARPEVLPRSAHNGGRLKMHRGAVFRRQSDIGLTERCIP